MSRADTGTEDAQPPGRLEPGELELWQLWRSDRDETARAKLLELHMPYARVVAASYFRKRFHNEIEFEEYLQLASVGLIEAADRFDPAAGAQFRTFAARRMHGSILDGLERTTEKQQQIAARQRLDAQRQQSLGQMTAAEAAETNLDARGATRPAEQVLQYVADAGLAFALSWILDGTGMVAGGDRSEDIPFYRSMELRELRQRVLDLVRDLPAQEKRVIHNHYLQEQPFDQIALLLGVSKSRVSQLHRQALRRLNALLRNPPSCNLTL